MVWSPLGPVSDDGVPPLMRVQEYPSGAVSIQAQLSTSKSQLIMSGRRGGREGGDGGERGGGGDGGRVGGSAHASGSSATRSSHAPRHDPARHLTRRPELLLPTEAAPKRGGHIPKSTAMSANVR